VLPGGTGIDETLDAAACAGFHQLRAEQHVTVDQIRHLFSTVFRDEQRGKVENDARLGGGYGFEQALGAAVVTVGDDIAQRGGRGRLVARTMACTCQPSTSKRSHSLEPT